MSTKKIVVICGPTATGKTRLGIELARSLDGEIVSADSMQIYRGMDIGTAKATAAERAAAVHHMLDVADPAEDYSVARYVEEAEACCEDILSRGKLPILVGGTGLYIDSLISGRNFAGRDSDDALRRRLDADYEEIGGEAMLARLRLIDPERADKLHAADRRRIVRAFEIYELTGETATAHDERTRALPPRYEAATIVLGYKERAELYRRIDARVDQMVDGGLFDEVQSLLDAGLDTNCTAMQAIGYKEPAMALRGELDRNDAIARIKQSSRRYAKRQLTWFSRYGDALRIDWDSSPDFPQALRLSTEYLHRRGLS